jgi:Tfp pilus assembly protein PilW
MSLNLLARPVRQMPQPGHRLQRGLSLVELLVGIALGLFIVAAASTLIATQLSENRRLMLETQVQQDLRATADIITRELRRAGTLDVAAVTTLWLPDQPNGVPVENPLRGPDLAPAGEVVSYRYTRVDAPCDAPDCAYGLANNTIVSRINAGLPQALTDRNTLKINAFTVAAQPVETVQIACPQLCPGPSPGSFTQDCWPTATVTDLVVTIQGEAASDASVQRTVTSRVRVRNDGLQFNTASGEVCP